ncbi:MAG TPA: hypothetical protein VN616_16440 [Puia sp.]|nr:hypothetical protein [Puia sp.]
MVPGRILFCFVTFLYSIPSLAQHSISIRSGKMQLNIQYGHSARISSLFINGQQVLDSAHGGFTAIATGGLAWSSRKLLAAPAITVTGDSTILDHIVYGDNRHQVREKWVFCKAPDAIRWRIERYYPAALEVDASAEPELDFDKTDTWDGAYQGYGGLAWFYLFNERLCTYGVHTNSSSFWNGRTGNGLEVTVDARGDKVAMKYTRTMDDRLAYGITTSAKDMICRYDSGTHRRRFIRGKTDVWASYAQPEGHTVRTVDLRYFDVNDRYGRGSFVGLDGRRIAAVLNTIARIGVIDSLHFGANSWHTPYGPICLHEQYIAQLGLGIDDPHYLRGYQSCLDFYRDHAIRPDGRVIARWAYSDEDMMPGQGTRDGFYEAQWGFLLDANPDFVSNVADLYDLTGDRNWVRTQQQACRRALDWILRRDSNGNGLVEMMTDSEKQKRGSDWIDIIWASYENAFVNAKLYHALVGWAAIERQLNSPSRAAAYEAFAARLKASFNKPVTAGGFWDETNHCYIHWRDKDGSPHGRNMVTPVNFMAIAYGICDDPSRQHAILDTIEAQMEREKLFFWPLCMRSYAPGEGNDWQWPFPNYENGDLFLSWGSIAVKAYASYKPAIAIKYIRNVLDQYGRDGLAFQRYGRKHQEGEGDDILAGNALSIVGLYQSIYGINPRYNRLYLDPHLTPELAGTLLRYSFHNKRLDIRLDAGRYMVADNKDTIACPRDFGFDRSGDRLSFFPGDSARPELTAIAKSPLRLTIGSWEAGHREWAQSGGPVSYIADGLIPLAWYDLTFGQAPAGRFRADRSGRVRFAIHRSGRVALREEGAGL